MRPCIIMAYFQHALPESPGYQTIELLDALMSKKYRVFFLAARLAIYHAPSPINRLNKKYDGA